MVKGRKKDNKKGKTEEVEKKRFLGFTVIQWTAFGVIIGLAILIITLGSVFGWWKKEEKVDSVVRQQGDGIPSKTDSHVIIREIAKEPEEESKPPKEPDDTTCVIVYYVGDRQSVMDAQTVESYLESLPTSLFSNFIIISRDSAWFSERADFKVAPEVIDTQTAAKILMNPTVAEEKERWVYFRIKEGLYVHDLTKGWIRHDTLALNIPGTKVVFKDIQPGFRTSAVGLLERYTLVLVLPPYPFYTRTQ